MKWRGLVYQQTDSGLEKVLASGGLTLYVGFDPTADSLHLGSLLPLLTLRRFQLAGHKPIAVAGGATGMIGDPSGKTQERAFLSREKLNENIEGITGNLKKFLDLENGAAKVVNNADWFSGYGYLEFLRDVGKHFSVNIMLAKESVKARLEDREQGMSYTEFSYMLLQAYDFYVLNQKENCTLQVGGSDQWGNITAGTELIRRLAFAHGKPAPAVHGLTTPLLTKADGGKFGKTESGTIWIDRNKTSPYQFYQYLVRSTDEDVIKLLKFLTFLSREEIEALEKSVQSEPEKREAQKALARAMTELVHGKDEVQKAEAAAKALFGTEIKELDHDTLLDLFSEAPTTQKDKSTLEGDGLSLIDALVETGLSKGKGAARKDISAGGIYVNNDRVANPTATLAKKNLIAGDTIVLRKGKKNYHLLAFS